MEILRENQNPWIFLAQNNLECPEMYLKDKRIHCEVGNFNTPNIKMNKIKLSINELKWQAASSQPGFFIKLHVKCFI